MHEITYLDRGLNELRRALEAFHDDDANRRAFSTDPATATVDEYAAHRRAVTDLREIEAAIVAAQAALARRSADSADSGYAWRMRAIGIREGDRLHMGDGTISTAAAVDRCQPDGVHVTVDGHTHILDFGEYVEVTA